MAGITLSESRLVPVGAQCLWAGKRLIAIVTLGSELSGFEFDSIMLNPTDYAAFMDARAQHAWEALVAVCPNCADLSATGGFCGTCREMGC